MKKTRLLPILLLLGCSTNPTDIKGNPMTEPKPSISPKDILPSPSVVVSTPTSTPTNTDTTKSKIPNIKGFFDIYNRPTSYPYYDSYLSYKLEVDENGNGFFTTVDDGIIQKIENYNFTDTKVKIEAGYLPIIKINSSGKGIIDCSRYIYGRMDYQTDPRESVLMPYYTIDNFKITNTKNKVPSFEHLLLDDKGNGTALRKYTTFEDPKTHLTTDQIKYKLTTRAVSEYTISDTDKIDFVPYFDKPILREAQIYNNTSSIEFILTNSSDVNTTQKLYMRKLDINNINPEYKLVKEYANGSYVEISNEVNMHLDNNGNGFISQDRGGGGYEINLIKNYIFEQKNIQVPKLDTNTEPISVWVNEDGNGIVEYRKSDKYGYKFSTRKIVNYQVQDKSFDIDYGISIANLNKIGDGILLFKDLHKVSARYIKNYEPQ